MQKEDYLIREIHKISELLLGLLGKLVRKKEKGEEINEELVLNDLPLEIKKLLEFTLEDFIKLHETNKLYTLDNLETIANILHEWGDYHIHKNEPKNAEKRLETAKELLYFIDTKSGTFSFLRNSKIDQITELLNN
ncbi:MAG: hypothetical protein MI922_09275 [Bacteroidales bacterium]|nr:hypothetical protein [Bacteroidales bacterium]